jgi:hypothetical protein
MPAPRSKPCSTHAGTVPHDPQETSQILALCAAYDSRTVGRADILAWHDVIGDVAYADAMQAVKDHYRDHRERITVADIRDRVRAMRLARVENLEDVDLVRDVDPDDPHWTRILQARRRAVLDGTPLEQAKAIPARQALRAIGVRVMTDDDRRRRSRSDALAEQYVLAAMIAAPRVVPAVQQNIQPGDFYQPRHETICAAIYRLDAAGEPIDGASVVKALRGRPVRDRRPRLHPRPDRADARAGRGDVPREDRRPARRAAPPHRRRHPPRPARPPPTPPTTCRTSSPPPRPRWRPSHPEPVQDSTAIRVGDVLDDYLDRSRGAREENPGIAFHTADLRRDLRPMRKGSLAVVAAWSGVGKSIASWNYAAHAAIHEKQTVLFHALEMSRDEMLDRLIAAEAKVDYGHITSRRMTGWDWEKVSRPPAAGSRTRPCSSTTPRVCPWRCCGRPCGA